ncbi:MAG: triple tyrosine motif-containing protein [Ferruginibacter sp.]
MRFKLLLFIVFPIWGYSQNTIGLPDVINYYKGNYSAGLQNWDFKQDDNGILYIANNEGLLSFDGRYWKLYPLPNKTIVRSVEIAADNKIYAGGQDELGYYAPGSNGKLQYTSLTKFIPQKDRSFGDVWDIVSYQKDVFFRTPNRIFKIRNEAVEVFYAPSEWSFMGICNGIIYAHDFSAGLLNFENNVWMPLKATNKLPVNDPVTSILPLTKDSTLITTLKNGIFILSATGYTKMESAILQNIQNKRIYAATKINTDQFALATNNGGVDIIDSKGQLIQSFSKTEGLQNNNVLSIFLDRLNNLWLGLDNGIDYVAYNSAIKHITPNSQDGSGYTAIIHDNNLYIGTSGGLFNVPLQVVKDLSFSKGIFSAVSNTSGQTWGLADINGQLLLGHHDGTFVVNNNAARNIYSGLGFWNFTPMSGVFPTPRIVAGNYKGLSFFNYSNENFTAAENIPGFNESSRFVTIDKNDNIWVSHPYRGVYKITATPQGKYTYELFTNKNGLPSSLNNNIYKIRNELVVTTDNGVYAYNESSNNFEPAEFYKKIFGQQSLRYLKEDTQGNIWFIHEKNLGVVDMSGKEPAIIYLPELNNKMLSGFEFIYPVNENNIFLGGEKGFYDINFEKYKKSVPVLQVQMRAVRIINSSDSLLFGGYFANVNEKQMQGNNSIPDIANQWKTIHLEFSSPVFGQQSNLEYSYRLKGFDDNWAAWSNKTEKEYTNLPAGTYVFEIKARNNLGNESQPVSYTFKVLPPWYKTTWAYLFYFLLCCVGLYFLYKSQVKKFNLQQDKYEEEQKRLRYLHQLEIDKAENELVALRNEKLQGEIDFKNSELATTAMHLVQKGELLTKIKEELNRTMKVVDNEKAAAELKKMIKVLSEDDKMDKDWEHFAQHFDKVHSDFVVSLKEKHSTITPNELKLCAYLRMNLSTKEIAQLMNISVRGIEISRYRLRKKLNLATETSLFDYLMQLNDKN